MRHRLWLFVLTLVVGLAPLIPAVPAAALKTLTGTPGFIALQSASWAFRSLGERT